MPPGKDTLLLAIIQVLEKALVTEDKAKEMEFHAIFMYDMYVFGSSPLMLILQYIKYEFQ